MCQVKCFEDFEEACRHEEDCQNQVDQQQQQQQHLPPTLAAPAQPVTKSISNKPIQELQATQVAVTPPPPQERPKQPKKSTAKAPTAAVNSFFAPLPHSSKATKIPPTATATATAKELPTQKPKASVAAFFAPRGTKKTTPKESLHSKICVIDVDQLPNKKKLQQEVIEIHKEEEGETRNTSKRPKKQQHTMTVEHAAETAFALANIIDVEATTTNTNVPSFFNKPKEFIAEQRTAEFQAKRRMERLKELERQQKRQKADKPTPPSPSKRKPQRKKPLLPMAQRFPVPSHVLQIDNCRNDNSTVQLPPQVSPCWRRQPHTTPFVSQKEDSPVKLVSSPSALDSIEETRDLISEAMRNLLISPTTRCTDSRMWVDKYGMDSSGIVGQNTQETAQSLQHWINEWRTARQGAMDRMAERQRKLKKATKKKARKVIYKNDDDLWSDDEDHLLNVCLLTGPPASGKTSLVRQVARQCDCQVLEINTTEARGGAALKHAIQEATQSCSSLDLLKKKKSSMHKTFGGTTRNPWDDSDDDDDESVEPEKSSLTVILIDEADITYEQSGDSGFWTALHSVAKTAKCPIFLTCNRVPRQMASMHYVHRTTHRPSPMDCATKLLQVCQHEQIQIQPGLDADIIHSRLAWIAQVCNCDLRRMMHELQSFAFSSSSSPPPPTSCPTPTTRNMDDSIPTPKRERPIICSMEPAKVPADAFSIVTLKGNHLGALAMDGITVCIGPNECQTHRVDEETLMILCPPCPSDSLEMRIAALSIQSLKTPLTLDSVERTQLADGTCFLRGKRFSLEYEFRQEDDEDSVMDNGEHELDGESNHQGEYEEMEMSQKSKGTMTIEEGMSLWRNDALSKLDPTKPPETTTPRTTEEERQIQETLESLSKNAEYASDAALLEDMQDGIPFLSGACRGFAFDLTEEGEATSAKMRKHENSRP